MGFIVNGETYKTQKDYFYRMNPEKTGVKQCDIDNFLYHNVKEYREKKRAYYREKYRKQRENKVRRYVKYDQNEHKLSTTDMSIDEFQNTFFISTNTDK